MYGGLMVRVLLDPTEGEPFEIERTDGRSPVILVCEHASRTIPRTLSDLGAKPETLTSHAAWDIGALAVARKLSELLDAPLIHQRFSRLVYDCNRPPDAQDAIPERSEIHAIPGNRNLSDEARRQRVTEIYEPFRQALAELIAARTAPSRQPVIVTIHSFTRVYFGIARHRAIGLLHDRDLRLADAAMDVQLEKRNAEERGQVRDRKSFATASRTTEVDVDGLGGSRRAQPPNDPTTDHVIGLPLSGIQLGRIDVVQVWVRFVTDRM